VKHEYATKAGNAVSAKQKKMRNGTMARLRRNISGSIQIFGHVSLRKPIQLLPTTGQEAAKQIPDRNRSALTLARRVKKLLCT